MGLIPCHAGAQLLEHGDNGFALIMHCANMGRVYKGNNALFLDFLLRTGELL